MALLTVTGVGDPLVPVNCGVVASPWPAGTDKFRLQGREMIQFANSHASTGFRVRFPGTGKGSFGNPEPWPYYGQGTGGKNSWLVAAQKSIIVGPFMPYRHADASGLATIEYLTDPDEDPFTTVAATFRVAVFRIFPLPL